jgi:hypothetical protein
MPWYSANNLLSEECRTDGSGSCDGTDCDCSCHGIALTECAGWTTEDYRKWHSSNPADWK